MKRIILTLLSAVITLIVSAQEKDTTIVIYYGYQAIDTVTISKSSEIYLQMQDAELVVKGITDDPTKHRAIVEYVLSHPDSDGSLYLMRYLSGMINYKKCLPALSERVRHGIMKRLYDFFIAAEAETDAYLSKTAEAIAIGKEATGFSLEDIDGNLLTLSSLRGKYVMLDFWGSWCGACIKSFPHLKAFYEQHHNKLEIIGIACHDTKEKWNAAVKRHELPWLHVLNGEGTNDVAELYGVQAYPTYVLIAPDGRVLQWMSDDPDTFDLYFNDLMIDK
jgi:thiol-disulfide isomerase/thioredoxin